MSRKKLRRWSAEVLMGWKFYTQENGIAGYLVSNLPDGRMGIYEHEWAPDSQNAPGQQIIAVIEKMREKGWWMVLHAAEQYIVVFQSTKDENFGPANLLIYDTSMGLAILKAAHAALEEDH